MEGKQEGLGLDDGDDVEYNKLGSVYLYNHDHIYIYISIDYIGLTTNTPSLYYYITSVATVCKSLTRTRPYTDS